LQIKYRRLSGALRPFPIFAKVARIMRPVRFFLPVLLAFALLFAQQGAAMHVISHVVADQKQQHKHSPHSPNCEQCEAYAQLGGALNSSTHSFALDAAPNAAAQHRASTFRSTSTLAALARGPPSPLQKIA
jgi:hypothetical protein